jgi:gas vesicle protein
MITIILIVSSTVSVYQSSPVIAHNFSTNESASFLALTDALKAETQLVQQSIESGDLLSGGEHANRALALLNDNTTKEIAERNQRLADDLHNTLQSIKSTTTKASSNNSSNDISFLVDDASGIIDEVVSARIEPMQLNNATIQALRLIELLDKLLTSYGNAYGAGFDMTNMSMMITMGNRSSGRNDGMNSVSSTNMNVSNEGGADMSMSSMSINDNSSASSSTIVNTTDYETAQAIANKINEVFNGELTNASSETNSTTRSQSIDNIDSAIRELVAKVDSKAPAMDIMTMAHTKIHPNLITAFNLALK